MARLDADDMVDLVRDASGGETSGTLSDDRILRFINEKYLLLISKYTPGQLGSSTTITCVSGTAEYTLSVDDLIAFDDIIDTTGNLKYYRMSEDQYHQYTQGDAPTGQSNYWYISGADSDGKYKVTLWPTPNNTNSLTVHYTKLTELVQSPTATTSIMPRTFDEVIWLGAAAKANLILGNSKKSQDLYKAAGAAERDAKDTIYEPSYIPLYLGSRVGRAQ